MFFKGLGEVYSSDKQKDRQSEEGKKIFMGIFIHYRQGVDRPISICLIKFGKKRAPHHVFSWLSLSLCHLTAACGMELVKSKIKQIKGEQTVPFI